MRPYQSISSLAQNVKTESTIWVNENKFCKIPFAWQLGFAGFSYSKSHVDSVIRYIKTRKSIIRKKHFWMNTVRLLKAFEIDYDERYIFKEPE
jgi:hypothetical protein